MSEIRKIGKQTLVYGVGVAIGKAASFLMLPIYTHYLTPADYGVLELLEMTISVVSTLVGLGTVASVFKFHADAETQQDKNRVISTATLSILAISITTAAVGQLVSPFLHAHVLDGAGKTLFLRVFFLIYLAQAAGSIPLLYLRATDRAVMFVAADVAKLIGMLSLNVYFVVVVRMGVLGVLLSNLIVSGALGLVFLVFMFRKIPVRFSVSVFRTMAAFGAPMVIVFLGNFVLVFSDRFFLNHYTGTAAVGIYSLAYKFVFLMSAFAVSPFNLVWGPQRFEVAKRPDGRELIERVFLYLNLLVASFALVIALFVHDVLRVMSAPAFQPAYKFVALLLVAQILGVWTQFSTLGLLVSSHTRRYAQWNSVGVVAVVAFNFLLIPRYGIWGATTATALAEVVFFLVVHLAAQRVYPLSFGWLRVARIYGIVGGAYVLSLGFRQLPLAPSLGANALVAAGAAAAIYRLALDDSERAVIRRVVTRPRSLLAARARA